MYNSFSRPRPRKNQDVLPETELRGRGPQLLDLLLVSGFDALVVNHKQRVRRHVGWERRECRGTHQVCVGEDCKDVNIISTARSS